MQIAISGASGMVGSAVRHALEQLGHQTVRLVRPQRKPSVSDRQSTVVEWDPQVGLLEPQNFPQCDALIHLAGHNIASGRWTTQEKSRIRDSRVRATRVLAQQLVENDRAPSTVVSASAVGVYGNTGEDWVDESGTADDSFLAQVARDWEQACAPFHQAGLRVVHPRLGMVLSQQDGALKKMLPIFRCGLGGRVGDGNQFWSWISLSDTVSAILWMLKESSASGPYNVVSPNPLSNREFTRRLAIHLGRPAWLPVPRLALKCVLGELADALLLCSCRVRPTRLLDAGFQFQHPDLTSLLQSEFA